MQRFFRLLQDYFAHDALSRLLQNATKLFAGSVGASVIALVSFTITARALGPQSFGALAIAVTYCAIVGRLLGFQSWHAIVRYGADYLQRSEIDSLGALFRLGFVLDIAAATVAALLAFFSIDVISGLLNWSPQAADASKAFTLTILFSITGTPTAILRLLGKFSAIAIQQLVTAFIRLLGCLFCLYFTRSFEAFLLTWVTSHIAGNLLLATMSMRAAHSNQIRLMRTSAAIRTVCSRDLLRFFLISNLDGTVKITRELDVQVVGAVAGESAAGFMRIARQFAFLIGKFMDGFFSAIYPELAKLRSDGRFDEFSELIKRSSIVVGTCGLLALLAVYLAGKQLILAVFGIDYAGAYDATLILMLATAIWGFAQPLPPALMTLNRLGAMLKNHVTAALLYCPLLVILTSNYGISGAAWSFVVFQLTWAALSFFTLRQHMANAAEPRSEAVDSNHEHASN